MHVAKTSRSSTGALLVRGGRGSRRRATAAIMVWLHSSPSILRLPRDTAADLYHAIYVCPQEARPLFLALGARCLSLWSFSVGGAYASLRPLMIIPSDSPRVSWPTENILPNSATRPREATSGCTDGMPRTGVACKCYWPTGALINSFSPTRPPPSCPFPPLACV